MADEAKERTLDELLSLESYEGLTDSEIKRLIDFETSLAATAARAEAERSATAQFAADMLSKYDAQAKEMREAFDAACKASPSFKTIEVS